jgi:hypothetical protein
MRARCSAADGVGMGAGNRPHIHGSRSASSSDIARYLRLDRGLLDPEPTSSGEAIAFLTAPNSARVIAMTWKPFRGKRQFVRAFLPLLTCLMLVLTSFSGMAHAADLAGEASRASSSQSIPMATSIKCHRIRTRMSRIITIIVTDTTSARLRARRWNIPPSSQCPSRQSPPLRRSTAAPAWSI